MKVRLLSLSIVLLSFNVFLHSQGTTYKAGQIFTVGAVTPATCSTPDIFILTGATPLMKVCTTSNVWTTVGWSGSSSVPQGAIIFVASGTCPATYTEVSGLNGRMIRGTVAANGNVGTTGGSDSVTPTFTGNSITSSAVSGGTPAGSIAIGTFVNVATATTGNCATTNIAAGTGSATACKATAPNLTVPAEGHSGTLAFTGSALGTHTHTTTATGTISAVDTKAAYLNLIGCSKD